VCEGIGIGPAADLEAAHGGESESAPLTSPKFALFCCERFGEYATRLASHCLTYLQAHKSSIQLHFARYVELDFLSERLLSLCLDRKSHFLATGFWLILLLLYITASFKRKDVLWEWEHSFLILVYRYQNLMQETGRKQSMRFYIIMLCMISPQQ
jgi:hypothetical protein